MITTLLARLLTRLAGWLSSAHRTTEASFTIGLRDQLGHNPTPLDLLAQLKSTAWSCASINAAVCASFPPRLFVSTRPGQPAPRAETRRLELPQVRRLQKVPHLSPYL